MSHYFNKKDFRNLLVEYQSLNEFVDDSWLKNYKKFPKKKLTKEELEQFIIAREDFKKYRYEQYANKKLRFAKETPMEKLLRLKRVDELKNLIATGFFKIIDGVAHLSEFNNKNTSYELLQDMKSEAIYVMYTYVERFDVRRPNPFSFFTQTAKNAFRQKRDEWKLQAERYPSLDFVENLDKETDDKWME